MQLSVRSPCFPRRWIGCAAVVALGLVELAAAQTISLSGPEPTPAPAAAPSRGFWGLIFNNLFTITVVLVFLGAIIGALINARRRDRVLEDFAGYGIAVILQDGRRISGILHTFPNGIELVFPQPQRNSSGNVHNSFILYQSEFAAIRAILRLENQLSPQLQQRRLQELHRYYHPTLFLRFNRWLLKQYGVLRDALMKSFALLIGQAKRVMPTSTTVGTILSTQDKQLTDIGATVLGAVNLMNDPILEKYIGGWCVAEVKEGDGWREVPGILKEYSTDWIELLEAAWPRDFEVVMPEGKQQMEVPEAHFILRREGSNLVLENQPPEALEIVNFSVDAANPEAIDRTIPPGETVRLDMAKGKDGGKLTVRLRCLEPADVILPRSISLVRYAGRREQISWLQAIGLRRRKLRVRRSRRGAPEAGEGI